MSEHRPVESSAKLIAICTLMSRVTGLARDMLLMHTFGLSWTNDAFNYAFQLPNLFRRLFGEGALAAVFVPTFTRSLEHEGRESAWQILSRTLGLMSVVLTGLILVFEGIVLAIWLIDPDGPARQLILTLTAIMLPFMLTICVVALFSSILNCLGSFTAPALAPIVLNLVMILSLAWLGPAIGEEDLEKQVVCLAMSVMAAGVVQLILLTPVMRAKGVKLGWSLDVNNPHVREITRKMGPVLFGQGILLVGTFLDAQICALFSQVSGGPPEFSFLGVTLVYPLKEGALSAVSNAQRLYQFPLGVFGISLAVAALPTFSRLAARGDWEGWTGEVTRALRMALFIGLLSGGMMTVMATPIVRFLFEYGEFDAAATARSSRVLALYGLAMWAYCVQHIILRGFYSMGDVRTPVKISCVIVPVNLSLSLALIWVGSVGEAAFAISSAVTSSAAAATGLWLLQRKSRRRLADGRLWAAATKMLLAILIGAGAAWWLREQWTGPLLEAGWHKVIARGADTFGGLMIGTVLFLGAAAAFGLPETRAALHRRRV